MRITFVGGGNMAQAILGGLLARGHSAADLFVVEPHQATRDKLAALGVRSQSVWEPHAADADCIVLAVKPQVMQEALVPLLGHCRQQLIVSIAAGIRTTAIRTWLGADLPVVRAMPNTPALIQAGISGLFAPPFVEANARANAEALLSAVGKTFWVDDESQLDAVTAVSGSGPAYVFYFIEALEDAACKLGLPAVVSRSLAIETFLGGARLAAQSTDSPATLRANVTSKRGTTERAIDTFDAAQLKDKFIAGVAAAAARSHELGDELGRSH